MMNEYGAQVLSVECFAGFVDRLAESVAATAEDTDTFHSLVLLLQRIEKDLEIGTPKVCLRLQAREQ